MQKSKVLAILCSDLHFTLKPPVARCSEEDWMAAMLRPLDQIRELAKEHDVPILCAGDIFDHWRVSPELINWVIENLPQPFYAIPGQHDLPLHRYDDLHRSAFQTLVLSGKVRALNKLTIGRGRARIIGVPFGQPIEPPPKTKLGQFTVLVTHSYIWTTGKSFPGAPDERQVEKFSRLLKGYKVAVFGDNHKSFVTKYGSTTIINCGSLMRRKADEADYSPQIGLLHKNASITTVPLNTSLDKLTSGEGDPDMPGLSGLSGFLSELDTLNHAVMDFEGALKQMLNQRSVNPIVKEMILEALEAHAQSE